MKILVTGGAGFIGSHLVDRLLKDGHYVTVIDDFSTGNRDNLPDNPKLKIFKESILEKNAIYQFKDVDTVYHLAALTRPQESIAYPVKTNQVNVEGTIKVLLACKHYKIERLVFVSSTSLYGEQKQLPTPESVTPNPMSPYALTKLIGEEYCKLYQQMDGLSINIIRPFNVYGTRQSPNSQYAAAIPNFIDYIAHNGFPYITGNGSQSRDFIYIDDLVELLILAASPDSSGFTFNAGSGVSTSINDVYNLIKKLMKSDIKPTYIEDVYEPRKTQGDISHARDILGWKPQVSLEEGLKRTIEGTIKK